MRDKIFNEILKAYPSCHDINHKWELADKIFDIPVDGVQVTFTCPECDGKKEYIHNGFTGDFDSNGQPIVDEELKGKLVPCDCMDGKMVRHLTIGEALKMLPNMVYLLSEKINDPLYRDVLTTKDGGIVEVKG